MDVTLTRELRHRYLTFDSVASVEYLPGSIPELNFTRINRHWEVAARLAELMEVVLRQHPATASAPSLLLYSPKCVEGVFSEVR